MSDRLSCMLLFVSKEDATNSLVVGDVMTTDLVTSQVDTPLLTVLARLTGNKIRHMPIVDESNTLRGIISKRDMLNAHLTTKLVSDDRIAGHIMTRDVVTARVNDCLNQVARTLFEKKIGALPVVDEKGRLVGIVTEADFVRLYFEGTSDKRSAD